MEPKKIKNKIKGGRLYGRAIITHQAVTHLNWLATLQHFSWFWVFLFCFSSFHPHQLTRKGKRRREKKKKRLAGRSEVTSV
jgi:hypothetical protein